MEKGWLKSALSANPHHMLILLFWSALASAEPSRWWCTINARTEGNPRHFVTYGRDAWEGDAPMRCRRGNEERDPQPVNVSFSSKTTGFGANTSSVLTFNVTLWTESDPSLLSFDATAPGLINGSSIYWNLSKDKCEVAADVFTGSEPGLAQSLELGTISIKSLLFRTQ